MNQSESKFLRKDATNLQIPSDCEEMWIKNQIDHFSWDTNKTWNQRYFVCDHWWKHLEKSKRPHAPIFFYCGNEASVELYVNATGFMFESAPEFGALLVFAEHRYYGRSLPFGDQSFSNMNFLTHEQALADYATLIAKLRSSPQHRNAAVISFGGSYGGMLSAWIRQKYPHLVDGAIAASAPVLAFPNLKPRFDPGGYWRVVTHNFGRSAAGGAPACEQAIRASWAPLMAAAATAHGRKRLGHLLRLCDPAPDSADGGGERVATWLAMALDVLAMGNYPYPSSYLTGGPPMPAWPVRAACAHILAAATDDGGGGGGGGEALVEALGRAAGVYNNFSGDVGCYQLPKDESYAGIWDFQWCTELLPQESYFPRDGRGDMFFPARFSKGDVRRHCQGKYGVEPRRGWIAESYGGEAGLALAGNLVLSNGRLDPWSAGGVQKSLSESVVAVWIEGGAHHLDLFYAHPLDPPSVIAARELELDHVRRWVDEARRRGRPG